MISNQIDTYRRNLVCQLVPGRVSEQEGLEGWVQSKITKAADYMGAVYHNMDYEMKFDEVTAEAKEEVAKEGKAKNAMERNQFKEGNVKKDK